MPDPEIVFALRNAVVRGQSLEQAMKSMINAGYSEEEVGAATSQIKMMVRETQEVPSSVKQTPAPTTSIPAQEISQPKPKRKRKLIILLASLLGIIALGIIVYILLKMDIL